MVGNDSILMPENAEKFYCEKCDFKCRKKSNWNIHIKTRKHNNDSIMIGNEDIYDIFLTKTSGSDIVGISPEDLNTLQEIANAIGNDANFITTINNELNFNDLQIFTKYYLILFMIIGRIELLTLLIICKKFLFKS